MRVLYWIKEGIIWAVLAVLLYVAGTPLAFLVLREAEWRPRRAHPDWIDSTVGIGSLLVVCGIVLALGLAAARASRNAPRCHESSVGQ